MPVPVVRARGQSDRRVGSVALMEVWLVLEPDGRVDSVWTTEELASNRAGAGFLRALTYIRAPLNHLLP